MRNAVLWFVGAVCFAGAVGSYAGDHVLGVKDATGEALVQTPSSDQFVPAEKGQSYPWGSRFKTGKDSSIQIEFSEGNGIRVMADALAEVNQKDKLTRVTVEQGVVQVVLEESFHRKRRLEVQTPVTVCAPTGSAFTAGVNRQADMLVVFLDVTDGTLKVAGNNIPGVNFNIPSMKAGDQLSVALSGGGDLLRIKNHAGEYAVAVPGPDGKEALVTLSKDQSIRVAIAKAEDQADTYIRTISLIGEDGATILQTWTVTVEIEDGETTIMVVVEDGEGIDGVVNPRIVTIIPPPAPRPSPTPVGDR
jgi:hypothetical protein